MLDARARPSSRASVGARATRAARPRAHVALLVRRSNCSARSPRRFGPWVYRRSIAPRAFGAPAGMPRAPGAGASAHGSFSSRSQWPATRASDPPKPRGAPMKRT
eukprot:4877553-Prymnesium_polylepis.1